MSKPALPFNHEINFEYGVAKKVAPLVRRIVANNPGPFTFKGTNTYIIGQGEVAIVDPGPNDENHRKALFQALGEERITHILLTHTHRDHSDGLSSLKEITGAMTLGYGPSGAMRGTANQSPSNNDFVDATFKPDQILRDRDLIEGSGWTIEAIHTPGHAPDHLCFVVGQDGIMLSGDHVMAWNTSVIAPPEGNMRDYMSSLERLLDRKEALYFPGHGGRIIQPQRLVKAYLVHRTWREAAILACVKDGNCTIPQIAETVYRGSDHELTAATCLSVLAHLEYLNERGLVHCEGTPLLDSEFFVS